MADTAPAPAAPAAEGDAPKNVKIFVGNISFRTTAEDLSAVFAEFGTVASSSVITRGTRSLGYGFVEMASEEEAAAAIAGTNKRVIDEREINVEMAKPQERKKKSSSSSRGSRAKETKTDTPRVPSKTMLFVANLPFAVDDDGLKEIFAGLKVTEAHIARKRSGRSKGFGFVEFANEADQLAALEARQGHVAGERELNVRIAMEVEKSGDEASDAAATSSA